jgi:hypothetical protein
MRAMIGASRLAQQRAIGAGERIERRIPRLQVIVRTPQREQQIGANARVAARGDGGIVQLREDRVVEGGWRPHHRASCQGFERKLVVGVLRAAHGIGDTTVGRERFVAPAALLVLIAQVEQRRHVVRHERERGLQFVFGLRVAPQVIGIDHRAIQMHFLGARDAELQRASERVLGVFVAAIGLEQIAEFVPPLRRLGIELERFAEPFDRVAATAGTLQCRRIPEQGLGQGRHDASVRLRAGAAATASRPGACRHAAAAGTRSG